MMSEKIGTKYAQNARFVGRRSVSGPLNDFSLAHLVSDLRSEARKNNPSQEELRCNLEFSDKNLLITYIKKDEGFESDGESTKSAEAVKIVLNNTHDDTSSANSSACSDSDDLAAKSASTSTSASPTAELAKYKFDHKESYHINDVLICHTAQSNIVWVMRSKDGLEATVVECTSEDEVKHLYKKFLDVSKRSKLERHRRRKSDGGSVVARSMEAIFNKNNLIDDDLTSMRFSLLQHTDRNGITHIEVEQPKSFQVEHPASSMGPSQQLVAKLRSSRSTATKKPASEKSKFAKELESILSKELETRKAYFNSKPTRPPGESLSLRQRAPALLLRKLDEFEEKANAMWAKAEAEAQAKAAKASDNDEENRKIWNKPTVVIDPSKLASRTPPPRVKQVNRVERDYQRKERLNRIKAELLNEIRPAPTIVNTTTTSSESATTSTTTTVTAAAIATPSMSSSKKEEKQILVPTKTGKEPVKKLYPKDQVVPEFLHHNRAPPMNAPPPGPRFMLALPSPMQFTAQPHSLPIYPVNMAPIPVWAAARYAPNSMAPPSGDFNDTNNNMGHIWAAMPVHQRMAPAPSNGGGGESGRGRSRDRSKVQGIDPDQRRRAQSKSPARLESKDSSHSGPISGGLTRKFREFGDAFRQRISRKSANISVNSSCHGHDGVDGGQLLKSNLKKKNDETGITGAGNALEITNNANNDNKKVHFNKFATVQMME